MRDHVFSSSKACLRITPVRRVSLPTDVEEPAGESIINANIIFPIFVSFKTNVLMPHL